MKQLKFRAWYEGKMIFSNCAIGEYNFECNNKGELVFYVWNDTCHTWDLYTDDIMMCTGLNDVNDMDIYEGDCISVAGIYTTQVVFQDGAFGEIHPELGFIPFAGYQYLKWENNKSKIIEVLGNKYE